MCDSELQTIRFSVSMEDTRQRLDHLLARKYPSISREKWQRRIREGQVSVNGHRVKTAHRLQEDATVEFHFPKKPEPAINSNYRFLYGINPVDDIIAIDKPADLPVHPSGVYYENTLTSLLKKDMGTDFPLFLLNRLDRETSGIVLLARTANAARSMQKQFINQKITKLYQVLVQGRFPDFVTCQGWLGKKPDYHIKKKMHLVQDPSQVSAIVDPKAVHTDFACRQIFADSVLAKKVSLLEAHLHTGRMHQIRASLFSIGYPVIGDRLYGVDDQMYLDFITMVNKPKVLHLLGMNRTALHCCMIQCEHPGTGKRLTIQSAIPDDMRLYLKQLTEC